MEISETLTRKMGPLPTWGWIAIGAVAGWYFLIHKKSAGTSGAMFPLGTGTGGQPSGGNLGQGGGGGGGTQTNNAPSLDQWNAVQNQVQQILQNEQNYNAWQQANSQWLNNTVLWTANQLGQNAGLPPATAGVGPAPQPAGTPAYGWFPPNGIGGIANTLAPPPGGFSGNPWSGTSGGLATYR